MIKIAPHRPLKQVAKFVGKICHEDEDCEHEEHAAGVGIHEILQTYADRDDRCGSIDKIHQPESAHGDKCNFYNYIHDLKQQTLLFPLHTVLFVRVVDVEQVVEDKRHDSTGERIQRRKDCDIARHPQRVVTRKFYFVNVVRVLSRHVALTREKIEVYKVRTE